MSIFEGSRRPETYMMRGLHIRNRMWFESRNCKYANAALHLTTPSIIAYERASFVRALPLKSIYAFISTRLSIYYQFMPC